jgi:hypothetical protein
MRELLAEIHHRAWLATALAAALTAVFALLHLALPAALAAMATGGILMWISEEETRVVAAMAPAAMAPANDLAPVLAAAPAFGSAVLVREWSSPFPGSRSARSQRPQDRRAGRRHHRTEARNASD